MKTSVIVFGPQACGKTRNAEKLKQHFGLDRVIEHEDYPPNQLLPTTGALILTNRTPPPELPDFIVVEFDAAMSQLANGTGSAL